MPCILKRSGTKSLVLCPLPCCPSLASLDDLEHTSAHMDLRSLQHHTPFAFLSYQEQFPACVVYTSHSFYLSLLGEGQILWTGKDHLIPYIKPHQYITATIFLSVFSCLQEHTNPTILMDAKQYASTLFLFLLCELCVFDNHCYTQISLHHHNDHRHHAIALLVVVSRTNHGHPAIDIMDLPQLLQHTFPASYTDQGHTSISMHPCGRPRCTSSAP